MSGSSGAGAPPPAGVVRSSALSFVAPAQPTADPPVMPANSLNTDPDLIGQADRLMPAGLKALCDACSKLYPDQPNPLQVTTRLKYWLGGQDPLDYISMYWNPGKPEEQIPPHWHYVSFGLSDLHGDGRVHPAGTDGLSGYGLELTLRVSGSLPAPPLWPAALLQALARYIFTTGNKLCAGDHISWHRSLDGGGSRLRHLLVAGDPQLGDHSTPHGNVSFLQVVGCTGRELKAAQRGSGFEVLKLMSEDSESGGSWLVTRPSRRTSSRGVCARARHARATRHTCDTRATCPAHAQLAGVCARVRWTAAVPSEESSSLPSRVEQQIKDTLQRGLSTMSGERTGPEGHMSTDSFEMSSIGRALPEIPEVMEGSWRGDNRTEYLDSVHIVLNAEGASLLPLAIDGRVLHGSSFTWRECNMAVSFVPSDTDTTLHIVNNSHLQVLIPKSLAEDMSEQLSSLSRLADTDSEEESDEEELPPPPLLPATYSWEKHGIKITVLSDSEFL